MRIIRAGLYCRGRGSSVSMRALVFAVFVSLSSSNTMWNDIMASSTLWAVNTSERVEGVGVVGTPLC